MKHIHHQTLALTTGLTLACLSFTLIDASAQRPGKKRPAARVHPGFDIKELGAIRDKIAAYKRLTFGGAGYYSKENHGLRERHVKTYMIIRNSLVEDGINEELGRSATQELLSIGETAKELRGARKELNDADAKKIASKISTLSKRITKARESAVNPDTLTPKINERQVMMEELYLYAVDSQTASKGNAATLRRHLEHLEKKEASAKKDGEISDRDREKLVEETIDVWKAFAKVLKP